MVASVSRLEAVTVYARGALVTRVATVPAGTTRVAVAGLPLAVLDPTVRVVVAGPAIATALRVELAAPAGADAAPEDPAAVRAARHRVLVAAAEVDRLEVALAQLAAAPVIAEDPAAAEARPVAWEAVVVARGALVATRAARELRLREQLGEAMAERETAQLQLAVQHEIEARATSDRGARIHELRKTIAIELVAAPGDGEITVRVEYQVRAARWAPSYVARLDDAGARLELRAVVAQRTGEDWAGARLTLSTAEPAQLADLPELAPQKIGRQQDAPGRRGFRAAPVGADALYADFDRTRTRPLVAPPPPPRSPSPSMADEVWDDGSSRSKEAFATPVGRAMPMMPAPAPAPAAAPRSAAMAAPMMMKKRSVASVADERAAVADAPGAASFGSASASSGGGGGGGGPPSAGKPEPVASPPVPRLDYAELRMLPPTSTGRGRLAPAPPDPQREAALHEARMAADAVAHLLLPRGCADAWAHTYDYAFAADGLVEVAADGAWHALAITARATTATVRHVAVPREQPDVFRVAAIANPFDGPLLPGPIDVYDRGQFLVTSEVETTPPAGRVEIGLGVDPQVKIARNTEYREEATGMLRGGLRLHHAIAIDVDNLSGRAIELDVRERVPVTAPGDETVEVTLGRVEPAWEKWTPDPDAPAEARLRGAYRWRIAVPAHGQAKLRAGYEVKLASKLELVGGNRREA